MDLIPQDEVVGAPVLDGFVSQDGEHIIRWFTPPDKPYPIWWCINHKKSYYEVCALQDDLPKNT